MKIKTSTTSLTVPVFQVVRFPNDVCISSGAKNGTCYTTKVIGLIYVHLREKFSLNYQTSFQTQNYSLILLFFSEECSSKGGVNAGSCASGFGVCCTCK